MPELKEIGTHGMIEETLKQGPAIVDFVALDPRVLIVAKGNISTRDWGAYAAAVPGANHSHEWRNVLGFGSKIRRDVAELLFPWFKERFTWRR